MVEVRREVDGPLLEVDEVNLYAVVAMRRGKILFSDEERVHRDLLLVEADSPEEAAHVVTKKQSVGALDDGLTMEVREVGAIREVWHAQYDGPPMDDHRATSAKLMVTRRVDLERV